MGAKPRGHVTTYSKGLAANMLLNKCARCVHVYVCLRMSTCLSCDYGNVAKGSRERKQSRKR